MPGAYKPLTTDEINAKLNAVTDPLVIDDVYEFALKTLAAQDAFEARMESRATTLFGAVGFSMTLAFSFGGWNLIEKANLIPHGDWVRFGFVAVLGLGVLTSWLAWRVVAIEKDGHAVADERVVFKHLESKRHFRSNVGNHIWLLVQEREQRAVKKAEGIRLAQGAFMAFLVGVLGLSTVAAWSAGEYKPPGIERPKRTSYAPGNLTKGLNVSNDKPAATPATPAATPATTPATPATTSAAPATTPATPATTPATPATTPAAPTQKFDPAPLPAPATAPRRITGSNPGPKVKT